MCMLQDCSCCANVRVPLTVWCLWQARDALGIIDKLSSNAQPTADMLCTRGQCCSALGNNALVRYFLAL